VSLVLIYVWRLAGDTLNITCNFLYCNHQVHRDFLNTLYIQCDVRLLSLSNPIFLPPAYSPALIYFGQERGWCITCNYPTVLKEKNINRNRKSITCAICWLKSVLHEEKRREQANHNVGLRPTLWFFSCSTDFGQQIAQVVLFLFLFMFFSFKTVG
jgi:hypothetical protein